MSQLLLHLIRRGGGLPPLASSAGTAARAALQHPSTAGFCTTAYTTASDAAADDGATPSGSQAFQGTLPRLVVFGGRGFVGSHIVQEALGAGMAVTAISPSGTPPVTRAPWTEEVEWVRGNALEPKSYERYLEGPPVAVISAVGGFGTQEAMLRVNGTANCTIIEAAAKARVPRCVFISANIPNVPGIDLVLGGYTRGKAMAEEALRKHYPEGGVAIRPGVVYGNRVISSSLTLPLQYVLQPIDNLLARVPSKQLANLPFVGAACVPPNSVHAVAKAAVEAAIGPSMPARVLDPWDLQSFN